MTTVSTQNTPTGTTTDTAAPLVELADVGKRYGNIIALREVTMTVDAGKVT